MQVIGDRHRAEHHRHASALLGLARLTAVELIQGYRLVHAATSQSEYTDQQNKRKAQKFHHPIQAVATRQTAVILI
ncbi:hypothetical protein D3C73_1342790 [compost metagenome]